MFAPISKRTILGPIATLCQPDKSGFPIIPQKEFRLLTKVGRRFVPKMRTRPNERGQMSNLVQHHTFQAKSSPKMVISHKNFAPSPMHSGSVVTSNIKKYASRRAKIESRFLPLIRQDIPRLIARAHTHGANLNDYQKTYAGRCQPPRRNANRCNEF